MATADFTKLNATQITALRTAVAAEPTLAAARQNGNDYEIAAWLNAASATDAWRVAVDPADSDEAADWTKFDNITQQGKRESFGFFLARTRDFSKNKVRKWITDVWGDSAEAKAILQAGVEKATRAQAVVGGTVRVTGSGGNAVSALDRDFIGTISPDNASQLR